MGSHSFIADDLGNKTVIRSSTYADILIFCVMYDIQVNIIKSANADQLAFSTAIADLSLFCQLVFKFDLPIFLCRNSKKYHLTV